MLLADTGNADLGLLRAINGLAAASPAWLDHAVSWVGEYGILLGLAALCLTAWLSARKRPDAPVAVAGLFWVPISVALSELANLPISAIVDRPRPFVDHPDLLVLVHGKEGTLSFVSDHSAMSMGVAVGLLLVNWRLGLIAGGLALLQGFCRMFMGVHYPTDVLGGYALATAVVLLLAPIAMAVLVPFCHALTRTALAPLVVARRPGSGPARRRRRGSAAAGTGSPEEAGLTDGDSAAAPARDLAA